MEKFKKALKIENERQEHRQGGRAQWVNCVLLLQRTRVGFQAPIVSGSGDFMPSSGLCGHLHSCAHTHT